MRYVKGLLIFACTATVMAYVRVAGASNALVVTDQPVGSTIFIKRLKLVKPGYILLRPLIDGGKSVPSVSDYLPAGLYTDLNVDIVGPALSASAGSVLSVELWQDNGDAFYVAELEQPVRRWDGTVFTQTITLH